jgi:hypothetical protein
MQQRQLRLGDVLDDYCPRERRLTNHVVVAMIGAEVKQTRCTTCEAEHEYKNARLPRLRRKAEAPALAPGVPKRHEPAPSAPPGSAEDPAPPDVVEAAPDADQPIGDQEAPSADAEPRDDEGPVHRPLIRASLPRLEGAPPPTRPAPDFTIRQPPGGRHNRFRPRHGGGQQPAGNRSGGFGGGGNQTRGGMPRHGGGPPQANRGQNRHGQGRKRSR